MIATTNRLSAARLRPHLDQCGYHRSLIESDVRLPDNRRAALAAFAHVPRDSRSACIAIMDGFTDTHQDAVACRALGAPVILVCLPNQLQWWITSTTGTMLRETVPAEYVASFFEQHRNTFGPDVIYRAKTLGRFDQSYQLEFVDLGLMPLIEAEAGRQLDKLLERVVLKTKEELKWHKVSQADGHWLLKANFWLLAAKILKDKAVPHFADLDLSDLGTVYQRLASHYGASQPVPVDSKQKREVLRASANEIAQFSHLGLVSTEALAYLYENTLITKETRAELGTHSTPPYLVDYILGKLRPWIETIPWKQQCVFEPACGHAAFLLAAMRLLGELLPADMTAPSSRHQYLRQRLHGCDYDPFALEIARLSLTLADVPNPNGWDLHAGNMFSGDILAAGAREATVVLANPPFEDFSAGERADLEKRGTKTEFLNKAGEMLWRVVTNLQPGAALGVVLPQGVLHSKNATSLRRFLATNFEIGEICLFPDKVFTFSDAESAVILARRLPPRQQRAQSVAYRRVRESDVEDFKRTFQVTTDYCLSPSAFPANGECSFSVPDLAQVWEFCSGYPTLDSVAGIGQGLTHQSAGAPEGAITESPRLRKGFVKGFARLRESLLTHETPDVIWLNLDPKVICRPRWGTTKGLPQLLLNYARVSREPWRLKAFLDKQGHPVTSRFLVVRPLDKRCKLEILWAICNSPLANAYSYAFSGKRDVLAGLMRDLPVPRFEGADLLPLIKAVRAYFKVVRTVDKEALDPILEEKLRVLHWRIDAEVLRLYGLPPQLEHQVLNLFSGATRRGVPFSQTEYVPKDFADILTLRDLLAITVDWEQTNERRARLLLREERRRISERDKETLKHLQRLTDIRIRLVAPLPLAELNAIASDLKRRGLWVES